MVVSGLAMALACGDRYTGPFRDPNTVIPPGVIDSAFGTGQKWFKPRTFDSISAATLDAQSIYQVEVTGTSTDFVALSIANGALRWSHPVSGVTNIVIVGTVAASIGPSVLAYDYLTGASKFSYQPAASRQVTSNGATDGTRLFVGNASGEVVALNPSTGAELWATTVDTRTDSNAVIGVSVGAGSGIVFAGGNGFLAGLNASTGAVMWKKTTTDSPRPFVQGAPGADSGRVTIHARPGATATWSLVNYIGANGAVGWTLPGSTATATAALPGVPACDGLVYALDGGVVALTPGLATTVWSRSVAANSGVTLTCGDKSLTVNALLGSAASRYNDVQVLRSNDGTLLAQFPKTPGTQIRIFQVLRNSTTLFFLSKQGMTAVAAP